MVIINEIPEFSRRIDMEQYNSLKKHFPLIQDIGWFKILWHNNINDKNDKIPS